MLLLLFFHFVILFQSLVSLHALAPDIAVCGVSVRHQWWDAERIFRKALIKTQSTISKKDLDELHQLFQDISDSTMILFRAAEVPACAVEERELGEILLHWTHTMIDPWIATKNVDKTQFAINANAEMDIFYKKRRLTRGWVLQSFWYLVIITHNTKSHQTRNKKKSI
jgi:hypothetical protein